ncbi:hypothetical protein BAZMOX_25926_0 [methanotrophic endosymbiont of Bathymodiolus azoricus (Menez Gwen)]|nr:hypothetical protein BAZMOX_25926_0 [methanotrophic endosymbiont of Bathymodiolus azoricus (Menez Gwen)]
MAYSSLILFLTFIFVLMYQEFSGKYSRLTTIFSIISTSIVFSIPIFYIIYAINFDTKITRDIIYALFQTNLQESLEFSETYLSEYQIIFIIFLISTTGVLLLKQENKESTKIEKSLLMFLLIYIFSNLIAYRHDIHLLIYLKNGIQEYKKELQLFKKEQEKMKNGYIQFYANKTNTGETYIVVIGESLNKYHMGIYGYSRQTTPLLKKLSQTYLKFEHSYSNHTHTMPVLSLSLTEANQLNKKIFYNSLSIIDILNKANFQTYWISNQNMYGEWDNLVSIIAHQADHLTSINHSRGKTTRTQKFDSEVLKHIKKILKQNDHSNNKVIFVHLMGSHGDYCQRYPKKEFSKFNGIVNRSINCYDNSVLYNDFVVSNIMDILKQDSGIRGFVYMSDHADDVDRGLGHNSSKFTYDMTQIPLIMWFSDTFKNKYSLSYSNLLENKNKLFSNDFFYDTLLGIMQVQTQHYNSSYDLSSNQYKLEDNKAFTLHGKKRYIDKNNTFYLPKH